MTAQQLDDFERLLALPDPLLTQWFQQGGEPEEAGFAALFDAAAALAKDVGMPNILAGVNLSHEEAYRQMKALGFRTALQGVAMHRGNEPGYCRPGLHVLDDWR